MAKKLEQLMADLPAKRRSAIEARAGDGWNLGIGGAVPRPTTDGHRPFVPGNQSVQWDTGGTLRGKQAPRMTTRHNRPVAATAGIAVGRLPHVKDRIEEFHQGMVDDPFGKSPPPAFGPL